MKYNPVDVVEVRLWGKKVGAVALDPSLGFYVFEYNPRFVDTRWEIAPLTMPLSANPYVFTDLPSMTYNKLPPMLADSLPDDFGNALIDAWMARQGVSKNAITALDRLAYMAKRGMGALEFHPSRGPKATGRSTAIHLAELTESARMAVQGEIDSDPHAQAAFSQIIQVGTSAGGARAKAVIAWNPATNEIRAGQFDVEEGFEHWLLKFDGMGEDRELGQPQEHGRIEYAYYRMAREAGITMSPCRLLEENGQAHFMTLRFDRDGNQKHHLQTLCAMARLDYKQKATHDYNQLFQTIKVLDLGHHAMEEAYRRMIFNVVSRNCDDHTKNTSFLMKQGGRWELSPAYDVTFAHNPKGEWTHQHLMSVNGKFKGISVDDMTLVADRFGIGAAPKIIAKVKDAVSKWYEFAEAAAVSKGEAERISANHLLK